MKNLHLTPLGANVNEIRIGNMYVLFSYQEAVAYRTESGRCYVTAKKWSATTSRHIKQWVGNSPWETVPQAAIDKLVADNGASQE